MHAHVNLCKSKMKCKLYSCLPVAVILLQAVSVKMWYGHGHTSMLVARTHETFNLKLSYPTVGVPFFFTN